MDFVREIIMERTKQTMMFMLIKCWPSAGRYEYNPLFSQSLDQRNHALVHGSVDFVREIIMERTKQTMKDIMYYHNNLE